MSGVAAWSIVTGTPFVDMLDTMAAANQDNLDIYLPTTN